MTRYLFSFVLLIAVALFGGLSHGAMGAKTQAATMPCHMATPMMTDHVKADGPCGSSDQAMSGACAIACLGSMVNWFSPPDSAPVSYRLAGHRMTASLILHGRLIETADRPPQIPLITL